MVGILLFDDSGISYTFLKHFFGFQTHLQSQNCKNMCLIASSAIMVTLRITCLKL